MERARQLYERAVFTGDASALAEAERDLDALEGDLAEAGDAEADLALARGRILHVGFLVEGREDPRELQLFERALGLYRALGESAGEAEALFWVGCFHQVVRGDTGTAIPLLTQACEVATRIGEVGTQAEAMRHLGIADHHAGRLDAARAKLEESVRLRRTIGLPAGAAADQVGLIYIALAQGRREDALALAEEAHATASACGAERIMRQIEEARGAI